MPRTRRGTLSLAEEQPRPRWVVRLIVLSIVGAVGIAAWAGGRQLLDTVSPQRCQATAAQSTFTFDPEQMSNAATIAAIGARRGLPPRAVTIALATAITESKLRNLRYGDRDSLGLFQQRPSQGWGTAAQILDPEHATNAFYDALVKVDGYQKMPITKVAQEVQRSAFPEAYGKHEQEGRILASTLTGYSPAGLGCRLAAPEGSADPARVRSLLRAELCVASTTRGDTVVVRAADARTAWAVGAWAVAKAADLKLTGVTVADKAWTRASGRSGLTWQAADDPQGARGVVLRLS